MRYNVKKWGGNMYKTANDYYKEKFGSKVYKLSIDGGFTCPNRDGTVGTGGCIFCSALGSGEFAEKRKIWIPVGALGGIMVVIILI